MCGICGVFEYATGRPVDAAQLRRMSNTLVHRGPDDEGFRVEAGVGLAVRRLSIIDPPGGHQPIANEDESIWLVFNGEIYNYQELRRELIGKGHRFRTRADTEVIPHLYEEHGARCVEYLDGMFAFALFDRRTPAHSGSGNGSGGRLLLARDPLGKKPLYYADLGGTLVFGSELKPILQDGRVGKDLDLAALHHYLSLLMVPAPLTIFQDIRKLPAGCFLECDAGGVRVARYWDYLTLVDDREVPEDEALAEIRRLLFSAVEKRLMADVPLGAFLSGGLDSSTVVAVMSRLQGEPVKTYSIGFEGPDTHNELPYARRLSEHCRTNHHEFLVKPDLVETVQEVVRYADEPFAISSAMPTLLIARAARQHVTVVLTGDGGDEIFGGYEHYLYERWAATYRSLPAGIDRPLLAVAGLLGSRMNGTAGRWKSRITRFVENARRSLGERRLGWGSAFTEAEKRELYAHGLFSTTSLPATAQLLEERLHGKQNLEPAARENSLDTVVWLADEMLAKVDRMSMAASVEARCPLLDRRLVGYMAGLSFRLKVPGSRTGSLKSLLRRSVADLLPADLLSRGKQGFNVPLDPWLRNGARSFLESVLSPERIGRRGLFDPRAVAALLARHQAGTTNASNRLYALLVFEVWAEAYL